MPVAGTRVVLAYKSTLAFLAERQTLPFRIIVAKHSLFALLLFVTSALVGFG